MIIHHIVARFISGPPVQMKLTVNSKCAVARENFVLVIVNRGAVLAFRERRKRTDEREPQNVDGLAALRTIIIEQLVHPSVQETAVDILAINCECFTHVASLAWAKP
jgi:hypothetical protein